jgi:hypothetical protein
MSCHGAPAVAFEGRATCAGIGARFVLSDRRLRRFVADAMRRAMVVIFCFSLQPPLCEPLLDPS